MSLCVVMLLQLQGLYQVVGSLLVNCILLQSNVAYGLHLNCIMILVRCLLSIAIILLQKLVDIRVSIKSVLNTVGVLNCAVNAAQCLIRPQLV